MDTLPDFAPVMLRGLTWRQAHDTLQAVDCAVRRDHWCSPVVVLIDGTLTQDSDGDLTAWRFMAGDRRASDWSMLPRVDDDGNDVPPTYRPARAALSTTEPAGGEG